MPKFEDIQKRILQICSSRYFWIAIILCYFILKVYPLLMNQPDGTVYRKKLLH